METAKRSLLKAMTWRVLATLITSCVAYVLTGKIAFALEIGTLDTLIKLFIYFAHERVWQRIPYGKIEPRDYQI